MSTHYPYPDIYRRFPTIITIENGIVISIGAAINQDIRLGKVLQLLGQPDFIKLVPIQGPTYWLSLTYINPPLYVTFAERQGTQPCTIGNMRLHFQLTGVGYLSPAYAYKVEEGNTKPNLLLNSSLERQVPLNTWQDWFDGKVGDSCGNAWDKLAEEFVLPELPTLTPVASATP